MAAPDERDEATETAPPKKSKAKLFIMLGVLVLLLGGGAAAWFFLQGGDSYDKPKAVKAVPPQFLALETFTVNLQGGEQFLQVDITLQLPELTDVDAVKQHMPRVRSRLLALLASKQAEDLFSPEGKTRLAGEIKAEIMKPLHASIQPPKVDDVLFTSFVIQ
mgnify:CR=1 FL=1